jgi:beta-lactamase regulating signal transducer with metallopeptidase domain
MISFMLYTVLVGLCIAASAAAADWLARLARVSARYVWIVAGILSVVLPATARWRSSQIATQGSATVDLSNLLVRTSVLTVEKYVSPPVVNSSLVIWAVASILIASVLALVFARLRRARREWPATTLHGQSVRVSQSIGPVVIGVLRPEIVVPRWVLERSDVEQRLILAHESAHIRARDPLIIAAACTLVALMPWNPLAWILLARIRLAIEIDCDRRVLRDGTSPREYGSLLVDVAERAAPWRFAAMALSDGSSHLHQRILAMQSARIKHFAVRAAFAVVVGLTGLLAACEAKMPTAAEIDRMDASQVAKRARGFASTRGDTVLVWSVDGVETTEAAAKAIPADSIATMNVSGVNPAYGNLHIYIVTKRGAEAAREPRRVAGQDPLGALSSVAEREQPAVFIDGVKADQAALKALNPAHIAEIEIMKGAAAVQQYGDVAKKGVIVVKTKPAGQR